MPKRSKPSKPPVKSVNGLAAISPDDARRYRTEDAMRTLQRAEEHRKDKGLMRDVKAMAKQHVATMSKLCK
jgi:hypothetical protein